MGIILQYDTLCMPRPWVLGRSLIEERKTRVHLYRGIFFFFFFSFWDYVPDIVEMPVVFLRNHSFYTRYLIPTPCGRPSGWHFRVFAKSCVELPG